MSDQSLTPLASVGAAFSAWAPKEALPVSFLLLQSNKRCQDALLQGKEWLEANDVDALKLLLAETLSGPQSACLYANMASLFSGDNAAKGRKLLGELREVLKIDNGDARDLGRIMDVFNAGNEIGKRDEWVLCAAALMVLSAADGAESKKESQYLAMFVPEADVVGDARKLYEEIEAKGVLERVNRMSSRQRKFLATHLFALMFADSEWHQVEQEVLDEFTTKLFITRSDLENMLKAIYAMFNLSVFD